MGILAGVCRLPVCVTRFVINCEACAEIMAAAVDAESLWRINEDGHHDRGTRRAAGYWNFFLYPFLLVLIFFLSRSVESSSPGTAVKSANTKRLLRSPDNANCRGGGIRRDRSKMKTEMNLSTN